jgi:DNA invertase Pin-like site-specific DNA recombinase
MNAERTPTTGRAGQGRPAAIPTKPVVRCAIYTRKSTDENLDSDFNSLDAQRESAEAYIRSQASEGWVALPDRYDDGAYSGATLERPALQRLLADVEAGGIDVVLVYKIDRFSRSLLDFTRLIEALEAHNVSLVSVTQQFNTTTSMGRLTLNILLSFAQFEREVITERIRDKVAACKKRGMWLGGVPPLGYDVGRDAKRLVVNPTEAELVRRIFRRYLQLGSVVALVRELNAQGRTTKAWTTKKGVVRKGAPWTPGSVYKLLGNPVHAGRVRHHDATYPGEHPSIVEPALWDAVQQALAANRQSPPSSTRASTTALFSRLIRCGACGTGRRITFTRKGGRTYRYYVCTHASKFGFASCPLPMVPAGDVEETVLRQVREIVRAPAALLDRLPMDTSAAQRSRYLDALATLDRIWDRLAPAEKERLVRLLVTTVTVSPDGIELALRVDRLDAVVAEVGDGADDREAATEVPHA